jgi:hypothetical protein
LAGYIKLYRKLLENPIMKKAYMLQLWVYCLLRANHEPGRTHFGKDDIDVLPGQFVTGRFEISAALGEKPSTIYKRLNALSNTGFLNIKSNNKNSLITVINWNLYQAAEKESSTTGNNKVTTKEQQSSTNKNDKNDKKYIYSSEHIRLAEKLKGSILSNNPNAKTPEDLSKWAADFEKMMRIDKRTEQQIETVMEFSQKDQFWKSNILSAGKLREQFDKLWLQKDKQRPGYSNKPPQAGNFTQREHDSNYFEGVYKDV